MYITTLYFEWLGTKLQPKKQLQEYSQTQAVVTSHYSSGSWTPSSSPAGREGGREGGEGGREGGREGEREDVQTDGTEYFRHTRIL